ncbi:hypothetical protein RFI_14427, partial [Reticulomyxa filosa]
MSACKSKSKKSLKENLLDCRTTDVELEYKHNNRSLKTPSRQKEEVDGPLHVHSLSAIEQWQNDLYERQKRLNRKCILIEELEDLLRGPMLLSQDDKESAEHKEQETKISNITQQSTDIFEVELECMDDEWSDDMMDKVQYQQMLQRIPLEQLHELKR